jgi:PAS domain-containing protein
LPPSLYAANEGMRRVGVCIALICLSCHPRLQNHAVAGFADLTNAGSAAVEIRGQWEFYPNRFLSEAPLRPGEQGALVSVPGSWNSYAAGSHPDGRGFASYRLIARVPNVDLSVSMMEQGTAVRVYANGKLICQAGEPAVNPGSFFPDTRPLLCDMDGSADGSLELVVEIANFNYRKGGMWNAPALGERSAVRAEFLMQRDTELMLVALLLIMALYHLVLHVYHRADTVPLWFGLFTLAVFVRTVSTNFRIITDYIPGLPFDVYSRLEFLSWFWIPALGLKYTARLFPGRVPALAVRGAFILAAMQSMALLLPARLYSHLVVPSQIVSIFVFVFCVWAPWSAWRTGLPGAAAFLFSVIIAIGAVGNDLLHTNEIIRTAHVGPYGLFFVILAQSLILSSNLLRTHKLLIQSDERYRLMIEGSRRMVFSLDRDFRFISANRTMRSILGLTQSDLAGRDFLDFVNNGDKDEARAVVHEALMDAARGGKVSRFSIGLSQVIGAEPVVCQFSFEVVEMAGRWELLGRAESDLDDNLLSRFVSERQRFEITNSLVEAEEISHRLVKNVLRYADMQEAVSIRVGLREIIINAIEHGNLAVTFEDKTRAQQEGDYLQFLQARCQLPEYRGRTVRIVYSLSPSRVIYRISDQGSGFDHAALLKEISERENMELEHGRGILMTLGLFDEVRYREPGNAVFLIKRFRAQ